MQLIYSKDFFLLRETISQKIQEIASSDTIIYNFSFLENSLSQIINELLIPSMFNSKKIIILHEPWFLTKMKISLHKTFDEEKFLAILKRISKNSQLEIIFVLNHEELIFKNELGKWIKQKSVLNSVNFGKSQNNYFKKKIKQWIDPQKSLDLEAQEYLLTQSDDLGSLNYEIQKLNSLDQNNFSLTDIQNLITSKQEGNIFEISKSFIQNDLSTFLKFYRLYIAQNTELLPLFTLLINNLVVLRNYLIFKKQNYSLAEIATKLEVHPFYLKKLALGNQNDIKQINDRIIRIYDLYKEIILGKCDKQIIPEYKFVKAFTQNMRERQN